MISLRVPPTFMPTTPSSHPLITWPAPSGNVKGWPPGFDVVSNTVPFVSLPVYSTVTVWPALAAAPLPSTRSWYLRPSLRVTVLPAFVAAFLCEEALLLFATIGSNRTATANIAIERINLPNILFSFRIPINLCRSRRPARTARVRLRLIRLQAANPLLKEGAKKKRLARLVSQGASVYPTGRNYIFLEAAGLAVALALDFAWALPAGHMEQQ